MDIPDKDKVEGLSHEAAKREALKADARFSFIGEMRRPAEIEAALLAANTGHLIYTTLHAPGPPKLP